MTPKEKAIELVEKFEYYCEGVSDYQQECAIIVVDEVLKVSEKLTMQSNDWWYEVKKEIQKLYT